MARRYEPSQNFFSDPAAPEPAFPARHYVPKELDREEYEDEDEVGEEMQRMVMRRMDTRRAANKLVSITGTLVSKQLYDKASTTISCIRDLLDLE